MSNPDVFIDSESVRAVGRRVDKIAEALPKGLPKVESAADKALSANEGSSAANALKFRLQEWSNEYDLLTRQVAGFADDLQRAADTWDELEGANADIFTKYGKDL